MTRPNNVIESTLNFKLEFEMYLKESAGWFKIYLYPHLYQLHLNIYVYIYAKDKLFFSCSECSMIDYDHATSFFERTIALIYHKIS
jgi:hypothetical protein